MSDNRPMGYRREDGVAVYRASSVGYCERALVASRRGVTPYPPSGYLQTVFDHGWEQEDPIIQRLADEHGIIVGKQQEPYELTVLRGKIVIVGHVDGMDADGRVVEIKTMGPTTYKQWLRGLPTLKGHRKYASQLTTAMVAFDAPAVYVVQERLREDADGTFTPGRLNVFPVDKPPVEWKEIRKRLISVEAMAAKGDDEWPECDVPDGERFFCFFANIHDRKQTEDVPEIDELRELFIRGQHWQKASDQAEIELKEVKRQIREAMTDLGLAKAQAAGVPVTLVTQHQTRLDTDKLRADMGEEIERYEYKQTIIQVRIGRGTGGTKKRR